MKKLPASLTLSLTLSLILTACGGPGNAEWKSVSGDVLPQLIPDTNKALLVSLVTDNFAPSVDVGYVIDGETSYNFIEQYHLDDWEVTAEDVKAQALKNLEKLTKNTEIEIATAGEKPTEKYAIIEVDNGYAAAHALSEDVHQQLRSELGHQYAVAVPVRDFFIAWHPEFSLANQFIEQVIKEYDAGGKYRLTKDVFMRGDDGITAVLQQN